jgi:hypothetical protein
MAERNSTSKSALGFLKCEWPEMIMDEARRLPDRSASDYADLAKSAAASAFDDTIVARESAPASTGA